MNDPVAAEAAPLRDAMEILLMRLERAHAWASHLRSDLDKAEHKIAHLISAIDSAVEILPIKERGAVRMRCTRVSIKQPRRGRPAAMTRQNAVLRCLAERTGEVVSSAQVRDLMEKQGLKSSPQYVHTLLSNWAKAGILERVGRGCYQVMPGHPRLLAVGTPVPDRHAEAALNRGRSVQHADMEHVDAFEAAREQYESLRATSAKRPRTEWIEEFRRTDNFRVLMRLEAEAAERAAAGIPDPDISEVGFLDLSDLPDEVRKTIAENRRAQKEAKIPRHFNEIKDRIVCYRESEDPSDEGTSG